MPEYACVQFTVMDHDFMLANDFAGEGFLALNTVPGIQGEEVSGFSALRPVRLPLTQPRKLGGKINLEMNILIPFKFLLSS